MRLRRLLLRYYPPGLLVEYQRSSGVIGTKTIDLLDLGPSSDVDSVVSYLMGIPILSTTQRSVVTKLVCKLVDKLTVKTDSIRFENFRAIETHILPMTNCAMNKDGSLFATCGYDGSAKLWDTFSGMELASFENGGHTGVVYALAFNLPFSSKMITGSFDHTAVVWDLETAKPVLHLVGHTREILCAEFCPNPEKPVVATASLDGTCILWDVETGTQKFCFSGHGAEIVGVCFSGDGQWIMTASFDHTARVWDVDSGNPIYQLSGHSGELSSCQFSFDKNICATGSVDGSAIIWKDGNCMHAISHPGEVMDVCFNTVGTLLATACADGVARIFKVKSGECLVQLVGHTSEVSRVKFAPNGVLLATTSTDNTCRVWSVDGECVQVLDGHEAEIINVCMNYEADLLITASKDNTCRIWRRVSTSVRGGNRPRALSSIDSIGMAFEDAAYRLKGADDFSSQPTFME